MVSLDEWDENSIKIKILLKGYSGTGKTRACAKMAGILAKKGYNVLYLDGEGGADREMKILKKELTIEEMKRIEYEQFKDYKKMVSIIEENINKNGDKLKLIIVDPMKLIEIARLSARDIYLAQGSAPSGYGMKDIKNKDSFDLSGTAYQLATTMVLKFLNDVVNYKQDIICTLMIKETTREEYKYKNEYDGTFDYVFETLSEPHGGNMVFKAYPKKRRGAKTPDARLIDNLFDEIVGIFKDKYAPKQVIEQNKDIVGQQAEMVMQQIMQQAMREKQTEQTEQVTDEIGGSESHDNTSIDNA